LSNANPPIFRIDGITLDEGIARSTPELDQECNVAIYDLLDKNHFRPRDSAGGPYHLMLAVAENRLVFDIRLTDGAEHGRVGLSLTPFRRVLKDYRELCDSYYAAVKEAPPSRIEAIDMGRRGLHDDGSQLLRERLTGKIEVDFSTARRLFTLISVLHLKG